MLAGKMAGYCSKLFGTSCWADQTAFIARGDANDEFIVAPSARSIEREIENLLSTDKATRADMAGALQKLEKEIVERVKSESKAREREEMIRALVETSQDWIWSIDLNGVHTYSNPAIETILGYKPEELVGEWSLGLMHAEDRADIENRLPGWIEQKRGWRNMLVRWRHKNGSWRFLESNGVPILNAEGDVIGFRGVDRDITERRRLQGQLIQAQKMEAVGQLAGGIAHDFNNLLQAILGYTDLILTDMSHEAPYRSELEQVHSAASRASTLTRQLLAFSRRQIICLETINLNELTAGLMKMLGRLIGEHIQLEIIPGDELKKVQADPGQIEQVIMNLCINARDAMPKGGKLTIETRNVIIDSEYKLTHAWAREGQYVLVGVTDTGDGIDKETLSHIFEPFFTTKKDGQGTGLGLSTVYGIIKQHNGLVHAYSEIGRGTTFKVYLPVSENPASSGRDTVSNGVQGGRETILVAEDENVIQNLAVQILRSAGYNVLSARDGEEALRILETNGDKIDLALLDVVMPRLGGRDVQIQTGEKFPHVRFLFTSGYSTGAIHTNFVLNEGVHFIQKPYAGNALLRKVREVLDAPQQ